jgi:hypothetical protein
LPGSGQTIVHVFKQKENSMQSQQSAAVVGATAAQKNFGTQSGIPPDLQLGTDATTGRLKRLIREFAHPTLESLTGLDGLKLAVAAMTILLTDLGGTMPCVTCDEIGDCLPDLIAAFGRERVLSLCEEIQYSEVPAQSALFQQMFDSFNILYFEGRLPDYKIMVVYDVWYWQSERCGYDSWFPESGSASGFIDFEGRQIFIRFFAHSDFSVTMAGTLIHEMAHAAAGEGHGEAWKNEMARLKRLGAPVED